jgi:hypothetical protein
MRTMRHSDSGIGREKVEFLEGAIELQVLQEIARSA